MSVWNAADANLSTVQAVISANTTLPGDTVNVPSGNVSWNGVLQLNKAISLIGAGITSGSNLTKITRSHPPNCISINLPANQANTLVRVSGFYFDCVDT